MFLLQQQTQALLVLEDRTVYRGYAFASHGEVLGEVVFNIGMTGYQEILTDPSYKGQIVTMTSPLIGNYGFNAEDMESAGVHLEGFIVREYQSHPSNWRSRQTLKEFLESHNKLGVEGIDTRALTRRIRLEGAMRGVLSTNSSDVDSLLERVRAYPGLVGQDLVKSVICKKPYYWRDGAPEPMERWESQPPSGKLRVIVLECGVKYNILRNLERLGCDVLVFPADTSAPEIFSCDPNGVLLSNGPGDPAPLTYLVDTVRQLLGKIPIFGICLGHQILGQALGGRTAKMKFGHRGVNQPAKNMHSDRIEITSQNHGFIVESESLPVDTKKTHVNLNDDTLERLYYPSLKAFSVHYHPEAAPGPHDATYLFDQFINIMKMKEGV